MAPALAPQMASAPLAMRTTGWADYALLDSGGGQKLERFGSVTVVRPEPQCLWNPRLPARAWTEADAIFEPSDEEEAGRWRRARPVPEVWPMVWRDIAFQTRLTAFRHLGVFPEQAAHWAWLADRLGGGAHDL